MNKPVISLWGLGPSYRRRVKLNILDAMSMGYDNMMDYVVLTDCPEDFTEFAEQTGKIKAIIDINKAREPYPWSPELEHIPSAVNDEKEYGKQYVDNMRKGKMFSYTFYIIRCKDETNKDCYVGMTKKFTMRIYIVI